MLKRFQVLLSDWQAEYVKFISERYDLSFSEALRMIISVWAIGATKTMHPEFKSKFDTNEFINRAKQMTKDSIDEMSMHPLFSSLYFEARKAVEYRIEHADTNKSPARSATIRKKR